MTEHREFDSTTNGLTEKLQALQLIDSEIPAVIIVINVVKNHVEYMSPRGRYELGVSLEELKEMGQAYYTEFFNAEDAADYVPKIEKMLLAPASASETITFFQQVRTGKSVDWTWHLSSTRIFIRDANGMPTHTITCAIPIDPLHHVTSKVNRLLEENNFLRRNQHIFASLTKREKEILRLLALGFSAAEIAVKANISEKTAITHRRNIKAKIGAQSSYDITSFAQAFDLI